MQTRQQIIGVEDLAISFGSHQVIDGLSFNVLEGETFGFLGANGSGKTTTLRALFNMIPYQRGTLRWFNEPWSLALSPRVGYLPEERGLYLKETVLDVMTYFGRLKGMSTKAARAWSLTYLEQVELGQSAKQHIHKLSGGMQQKVQLGVTIMNDPEVLILDEPTKGLDPVNRKLLNDIIDTHHRRGATIVMISHQMDQVEDVCDRVLLLKNGQAAAYGTTDEVRLAFGGQRLLVRHQGPLPPVDGVTLMSSEVVNGIEESHLVLNQGVALDRLLEGYVRGQCHIDTFTPYLSSMNDVFIQIYGKDAQ